ncbi:MAG: DUF177 domain-containing protein [Peptococcaceae bacterium]|jgi:uncharacterized protein|nr:DUF177 domain-containing protein [Peptococcaceae bacterium]
MKINIAEIRRMEGATLHYELEDRFPAIEFDKETIVFIQPVHVKLQVTNAGDTLVARGSVQTEMSASCGRCLEGFTFPLVVLYEDEWVTAQRATEEQAETALLFEKDEIEIQERIVEQILLALPMKRLCSAACRGLCPACGQNLNLGQCQCQEQRIDPRMMDLAKWRQD